MTFQTANAEATSFLPVGTGSGLGMRRDVFTAVGGFDETMDYCEDVDLCWRAQLAGHALHFEPAAVVHYRQRRAWRAMFTQQRRYGVGMVLLYRKFRGQGMPRRRPADAARDWLAIAAAVPHIRDPDIRLRWTRRTGRAVGRVQGSVRHLTFYV